MALTTDWSSLQAAIAEYSDAPEPGDRNVVVLSLPVRGTTAASVTDVAASLLRGLVNDYFETYGVPIEAEVAHISNTGGAVGPARYSLSTSLHSSSPTAFSSYASEIRTAVEQALEDLPKNLASPDHDTARIIDALKTAELLGDSDD